MSIFGILLVLFILFFIHMSRKPSINCRNCGGPTWDADVNGLCPQCHEKLPLIRQREKLLSDLVHESSIRSVRLPVEESKKEPVKKLTPGQDAKDDFRRLANEAVYATLQCNDGYASAVLSKPIPDKQSLKDTLVEPIFKYRKIGDLEFLFIELNFSDLKRHLVIGSTWSDDTVPTFIKTASALGQFWVNDGPIVDYIKDGIPIPVVKPEMLDELLNEVALTRH